MPKGNFQLLSLVSSLQLLYHQQCRERKLESKRLLSRCWSSSWALLLFSSSSEFQLTKHLLQQRDRLAISYITLILVMSIVSLATTRSERCCRSRNHLTCTGVSNPSTFTINWNESVKIDQQNAAQHNLKNGIPTLLTLTPEETAEFEKHERTSVGEVLWIPASWMKHGRSCRLSYYFYQIQSENMKSCTTYFEAVK